MISSKIDIILNYSTRFPVKVFLILIILLLSFLIKKIFYVNVGIKHKIHNFYINWFWISLYLSYYIILMLYLRYQTWGKSYDLKNFYNKIINFWYKSPLVFIIFLLLFLLIFLLLIKFRLFLLKEIRKRHIYQEYYYLFASMKKEILRCQKTGEKYRYGIYYRPIYNRILTYFNGYPHIMRLVSIYYQDLYKKFLNKKFKTNTKIIVPKGLKIIVKNFGLILLILIFFYDCFFNNLLIHKLFYCLPFYIVFKMYSNIRQFIKGTEDELNRILYERYYEEDNVLYPESTEEENNYIKTYLERGLISLSDDFRFTEKAYEVAQTCWGWTSLYIFERRFIRSDNPEYKDKYVYTHPKTGQTLYFPKEDFERMKSSKED